MRLKIALVVPLFLFSFYSALAQVFVQKDSVKVYNYVEQMPEAGYDWNKYLSDNLQYPEIARRMNTQGRVVVKFIVNEDGSLSDAMITRGIGDGCDEEVLRIIKSAKPWKPAKMNGKAVKVFFTLPVVFRLEEPDRPGK